MVRRGAAASTQHAAVNGAGMNGDVPPSTIAAQIVQNHSNVNARQEPENKALFGQLLQEYMRDPASEELNLETNAKLILVVAEAGLDGLIKDNPFAQDLLLPQTKASISVIQLTVARTPDVLLYHDGGNEFTSPPLFLRLFAKLIAFLGREKLGSIQDELTALLSTCISSLLRTSELWQGGLSIIRLYQACIDGKISSTLPLPWLIFCL